MVRAPACRAGNPCSIHGGDTGRALHPSTTLTLFDDSDGGRIGARRASVPPAPRVRPGRSLADLRGSVVSHLHHIIPVPRLSSKRPSASPPALPEANPFDSFPLTWKRKPPRHLSLRRCLEGVLALRTSRLTCLPAVSSTIQSRKAWGKNKRREFQVW